MPFPSDLSVDVAAEALALAVFAAPPRGWPDCTQLQPIAAAGEPSLEVQLESTTIDARWGSDRYAAGSAEGAVLSRLDATVVMDCVTCDLCPATIGAVAYLAHQAARVSAAFLDKTIGGAAASVPLMHVDSAPRVQGRLKALCLQIVRTHEAEVGGKGLQGY